MDIKTLVKNPFFIGGIVIVVVILLFGRYFLRLFKQKIFKNPEKTTTTVAPLKKCKKRIFFCRC